MTNDEILANLKTIVSLKSQIKDLYSARLSDEVDILAKYQVDSCNKERMLSATSYQNKINDLQSQMVAIQTLIEANLGV